MRYYCNGGEIRMAGNNYNIKIQKKWCKSCGICIAFCPKGVLGYDTNEKAAVVNADSCTGCMMCEFRCPDFAIKVERGESNEAAS
jgi:2-oxoglutarate ferredoxin oxidoreductase subunit delta